MDEYYKAALTKLGGLADITARDAMSHADGDDIETAIFAIESDILAQRLVLDRIKRKVASEKGDDLSRDLADDKGK